MAPRAKVFSRSPVVERRPAEPSIETAGETREVIRAIPLHLLDLLVPYRGRGRISLRIERLPHRARLSAGRNNGDRSWSLTLDELEGLNFLTPSDAEDVRSLAVRVISVDGGEGATIAVIDCPVGSEPERRAQSRRATDLAADQEVRELRAEVLRTKSLLREREAELAAEERAKPAGPSEVEIKQLIADELAAAHETDEAQRANERDAIRKEAAAHLEASRRDWVLEENQRVARLESAAEEQLSRARQTWQLQADAKLSKAEKAWKSEEAARLEAAQAAWREQAARLVADAKSESASTRQARDEAEVRKLRDALATATASLADREAALIAAQSAAAREHERAKTDLASGLANAEMNWRREEARRMSAAEVDWRQRMADREVSARAELTAVREGGNRTNDLLEEEIGKLRASLSERDATLSALRLTSSESDRKSGEFATLALAEAERAWKDAEAQRLAVAENLWREQTTKAVAAARSELSSALEQGTAELSSMRSRCENLHEEIAERDRELARLRAVPKGEPGLSRQEWEAKLSDLKRAWQEGEAARLSAAEERGRVEAEALLAVASERLTQAEADMVELRAQRDASNRATEFELVRVRRELEKTKVSLANREVDLALARSAHDKNRETWSDERHVTLHEPVQAWRRTVENEKEEGRSTWTLVRDVAMVASFAAVATLFLPRLEQLLPPGTLPFTFEDASAAIPSKPLTTPTKPSVPPAPVAPRPMDIVLRTANMRASPSKSATVVASLAPGVEITTIDKRGRWVLVETGTRDAGHKNQQGWVYASFLKGASAEMP